MMDFTAGVRRFSLPLFLLASLFPLAPAQADTVRAEGVFGKSKGVLRINGASRVLSVGESRGGVTLVSVSAGELTVEVHGNRCVLAIGMLCSGAPPEEAGAEPEEERAGRRGTERYASPYADPAPRRVEPVREPPSASPPPTVTTAAAAVEKRGVVISKRGEGSYVTPGFINGQPVVFVIDTGASGVSMNRSTASKLGLGWMYGKIGTTSTANGVTAAYEFTIDEVRVGDVAVNGVRGYALDANGLPGDLILLGMSYLSQVVMTMEEGKMVLREK